MTGAPPPEQQPDALPPGALTTIRAYLRKARSPGEAARTFLGETIWRWDLARMPRHHRWGALVLRMVYLVGRRFVSQRAQTQAMALTYTTMLALVPAFAIMVAVFSMRGLKEARDRLETFIVDALSASPQQAQVLSQKLNELVTNVQGSGGVAGPAFLVFLGLTVVALLSTLEKTINDVWGVKRSRSFLQKFVTYYCIATLGPLTLGTALVQGSSIWHRVYDGVRTTLRPPPAPVEAPPVAEPDLDPGFGLPGLTAALFDELEVARHDDDPKRVTLDYILTGTQQVTGPAGFSIPAFGLTVITFALLYAFLPNTRVRLGPAFAGALVATTLWVATKWALATSSSALVGYDTLYGSMAIIPITMFWLYLSWLIVILGAEMTFALQNVRSQRREELATETNELFRELVALRLVATISRAFEHGATPPTSEALADRIGAPHALCARLLYHLAEDGLLRDVDVDDGRGFVPARPIDRITVSDVIDSLREREGISFDLAWGEDLPLLTQHLGRANAAAKALASRVTLRQVVDVLEERARDAKGDVDPAAAAVSVLTARAIAGASGLDTARLRGDLVRQALAEAGQAPSGAAPAAGAADASPAAAQAAPPPPAEEPGRAASPGAGSDAAPEDVRTPVGG
ncbi:MAG: YihY family inner membrane protein [Planctomycetes bacterium]|nr:YihY family inner membrane protein [Planctomycetota bacterium]